MFSLIFNISENTILHLPLKSSIHATHMEPALIHLRSLPKFQTVNPLRNFYILRNTHLDHFLQIRTQERCHNVHLVYLKSIMGCRLAIRATGENF